MFSKSTPPHHLPTDDGNGTIIVVESKWMKKLVNKTYLYLTHEYEGNDGTQVQKFFFIVHTCIGLIFEFSCNDTKSKGSGYVYMVYMYAVLRSRQR